MLEKWECTVCGKTFQTGQWTCADGTANHIVATKEYLLDDAPSDPSSGDSLRDGKTRICNIPPDKTVLRNGESTLVPGGYVEFIRGRFSTSDPEIQHYLNKKGGFCNEDRWSAVWLTQNQQLQIEKDRLAAERQRLENDRNELLALQKQAKGHPVGARG